MPTAPGSDRSHPNRSLAPAPGVTPAPIDGSSYRFLSDVIIARELVEPAAMKAGLQASLSGRSLTEILVDNGSLSEDDLALTLAEHHRLDCLDLEIFAVDREAVALIEPDVARRFGALPIAFLPTGEVVVALFDPNGSTAALEFARLTDRIIQPAVASRTQIDALIASLRHHGQTPPPTPRPPAVEARVDVRMSDARLRSVPAGDIATPSSSRHAEPPQQAGSTIPPVPAPSPARGSGPRSDEFEGRLEAVGRHTKIADLRRREAGERARASEQLSRTATAHGPAAEKRAPTAEELIDAVEAPADGMSSAAVAAEETLAKLIRACQILEREAQVLGPELEALRAELGSERSERARLEARSPHAEPSDELLTSSHPTGDPERPLADLAPSGQPPSHGRSTSSATPTSPMRRRWPRCRPTTRPRAPRPRPRRPAACEG